MVQIQITQQDGLLAFEQDASAHYLEWNPLVFHAEFHRICRQIYAQVKPADAEASSPLHDRGFDVFERFLSTDAARALSDACGREIEAQEKSANTKINPSPELKQHVLDVIAGAMNDSVTAYLERYLGCFFRIDHVELMRSRPAEISGHSYKWHRDFDPMAKIHILVYLTDCGPESPATVFSTLSDTRRCADLGYTFPPRTQRVYDINDLFDEGADPIQPTRPILKAGDATVFTPSRILHRGDLQEETYRDLLVLNILPSMNPWHAEIDRLGTERLFMARSTLFYDPFTRFKPSIENNDEVSVPYWAQQGYHFPLVEVEE